MLFFRFCDLTINYLIEKFFSVRNAQTMGREKNFAEKLVTILSAYNSIEKQANIEAKSFLNGENMSMNYETTNQTLPFDANEEIEIIAAANESSLKMARLVEILFLSAKNSKFLGKI